MDVKIKDRGRAMNSKLDELKDGEPADFEAMARNRDYYEMQQIFLAEYDKLIREGLNCDWPHSELEMEMTYTQTNEPYIQQERRITEHGKYMTLERPGAEIYSGRLAKVLAYDVFRTVKILWEEEKFTAVKGRPELIVCEGKLVSYTRSEVAYGWYAQIYH